MVLDESLLEVREYTGDGYRPIINYGAWRVAILRYHPELEPDAIQTMQRHDETDEVFVLLSGKCILFIADGNEAVEQVHAVDMQPFKAYNIKQGAWHTHTLDHDAMVLVVENRNTRDGNSPTCALSAAQCAVIVEHTHQLWG